MRLIIDCDPGIDDLVALALAARSPELDIVAVTTTYGNAPLWHTTRNARDLLRRAGRNDVAVHAGPARPLVREPAPAIEAHGPTGTGYASIDDDSDSQSIAPDDLALLRALDEAGEPVTLVTMGPLTALAYALEAEPRLVRERVRRHIGMFGSFEVRGSASRWADYNAWSDPEAAALVLTASLPSEMVPLEVTRTLVVRAAAVQRLERSTDPLSAWLGSALRYYAQFQGRTLGIDGCAVHDVLPISELLDPGLLSFAEGQVEVDLDVGDGRGHTRIAPTGSHARFATGVDAGRARRLLARVFGGGG